MVLYPQAETVRPNRTAAKTARMRDMDTVMAASCSGQKQLKMGSIFTKELLLHQPGNCERRSPRLPFSPFALQCFATLHHFPTTDCRHGHREKAKVELRAQSAAVAIPLWASSRPVARSRPADRAHRFLAPLDLGIPEGREVGPVEI